MTLPADELAALRRRDPDALQAISQAHTRRLYRAARGMGFGTDEAEDLVQDTFLTFLGSLDRFEGRSTLSTWLFGILLRKAQERRRARGREDQHDSLEAEWDAHFDAAGRWVRPPASPDRALASRQMASAIGACLDDLSPQQREVLVLRLQEDLPAAEVGNVLGLTVTHIGVLLHRARVLVRKCLGMKGWQVDAS
ncbi:MAG: sigma-70 family RNA polymerase sigma factor [Acidobacteria bacterium]|nr:sigma-70 family RNA polymerase sigma factor [Acidobacteriota bacterium]